MLKKNISWVMFVILFGLIIIGFDLKDNMNTAYVIVNTKNQTSIAI